MKKRYRVLVAWTVYSTVFIRAENQEEAELNTNDVDFKFPDNAVERDDTEFEVLQVIEVGDPLPA